MLREKELKDLVSIGISTKNRWEDLRITLTKLANLELEAIEIIIFDDGSNESCPFNVKHIHPHSKIFRFEESTGLITRRNQLAREITAKYYLSLDDDSYIVSGSLYKATKFAESIDNLLCLSFPIYNPVIRQFQNRALHDHPYQVRSFIGCGHLLHREYFLQLGGYSEELFHQGEEMDIAARGFQRGLHCYHFPDLLVHHTASNTGRNWYRMDYYGARNNVLWNDWFVPNHLKAWKQFRTLMSRSFLACRVGRIGQIQGELDGFKAIPTLYRKRQVMSIKNYKTWINLPSS